MTDSMVAGNGTNECHSWKNTRMVSDERSEEESSPWQNVYPVCSKIPHFVRNDKKENARTPVPAWLPGMTLIGLQAKTWVGFPAESYTITNLSFLGSSIFPEKGREKNAMTAGCMQQKAEG
jgi:hypothetical protein